MSAPGVCLNIMKERQESNGVGTVNNPLKFLKQDYELLHQYFLIRKRTYIDDMFPPDNSSIGENLLKPEDLARVEWIRPTKMVSNPCLIVDGVSRFDYAQGEVGNCWFLAAVGALTFQRHIMEKIFPAGQSFQMNYAGIFHFRFWRFGKWVDVVIDDKLPTINGQLIFVHPQSPRTPQSPRIPEFWPALLEKAYAKVCGSYEDMKNGWVSEALKDFTGGVHMSLSPQNENPENLWELIYQAARANSLMGCGTPGNAEVNAKQNNGLVEGHAYTVTGVTKVTSNGKQVQLVRLLNPWGHTEWKGNWSDGSQTWMTVSEQERREYTNFVDDGEFWMSMEDFCKCFCQLDICNYSPAFLDGSSESHWTVSMHDGRWLAGSTAGGCMNFKDTFWTNPQFPLKITEINKGCEPIPNQAPNILVSLMQKPDKRNRRLTRKLYIGFNIYKMKDCRETSTASFIIDSNPVYYTKVMRDSREVTEFVRLEPGEYIIIPYTSKPNTTASFILGLCSKTETHTEEPFMRLGSDGKVLRQMSDHYQEINAEQLQRILNEKYIGGGVQSTGGFSLDACQSIIAMMDISVTGTLSALELSELLNKVDLYKDIFFHMDNNRDGILSLVELRQAVDATGVRVSDKLLKLTTLRFADSTGRITLERFIFLALRLSFLSEIFRKLADRHYMHLQEHEWLHLTMYS
ncbi:calpain-1 catalytic subunit [Ictalurus punctatus]|uniref:Calpain-1 catalytic subunit n=1 Tax=Ictalurus punctatus TaxID=7998 RepID=A0A2D0RP42_ICTPU|nr:calpain-1 catalytic subunit [Ictalurus punctatus]XP_047013614.2 calpain-1 catalytic subunit [Ictalurus punctatus]